MDGINRKQVQDVLVPQNDIARRPSLVPGEYHASVDQGEGALRIESNPFFTKNPNKAGSTDAKKRSSNGLLWFIAAIAVLIALFFVMNYFSSATVEVTPSSWSAHIEREFVAKAEGTEGTEEELRFQSVSFNEEKSIEVLPTIEKKIQKKASGRVIIFNSYSKDSQRLIKNTRLETPDHKIFRIDESVVVPGAQMSGAKVIESGKVEAIAYADVPGEAYNIGLSDFTIPGFKGDPRFTKFKAMSATSSPIGGGFSGTVKVPSDEVVQGAQTKLKDDLKQSVIEKARGDLSAKKVSFFPGSMVIKFEEVPQDLSVGNVTKVSMRAVVSVLFFDTATLIKKLAEGSLKDYRGTSLDAEDLSALKFTALDPLDSVVITDLSSVRFKIIGDTTFRGEIDEEKVRAALAGRNKKDFADIIMGQDNIAKADAVIRPMWNTKFPLDTQKIHLKIATPKE